MAFETPLTNGSDILIPANSSSEKNYREDKASNSSSSISGVTRQMTGSNGRSSSVHCHANNRNNSRQNSVNHRHSFNTNHHSTLQQSSNQISFIEYDTIHSGSKSNSSSSSVLISKMKSMTEKLRRHMVQTGDWPPPAVLFNDRNIYSSGIVNATTAAGQFERNLTLNSNARERLRKKRQRYVEGGSSQSMENVITPTCSRGSPSKKACPGAQCVGIVCSQTDLKAIMRANQLDDKFDKERQKPNQRPSSVVSAHNLTPQETISKRHSSPATLRMSSSSLRKQVSFDQQQSQKLKKGSSKKSNKQSEYIQMSNKPSVSAEHHSKSTNVVLQAPEFQTTSTAYTTLPTGKLRRLNQLKSSEDSGSAEGSENYLIPKEVEYDEHGQTWEIYGADPDPELLGQAIQSHLERLMQQQRQQSCENDCPVHHGQQARGSISASSVREKSFQNQTDSSLEVEHTSNRGLPLSPSNEKLSDESCRNNENDVALNDTVLSVNFKRFWQRLFCLSIAHRNYSPGHQQSDSRMSVHQPLCVD